MHPNAAASPPGAGPCRSAGPALAAPPPRSRSVIVLPGLGNNSKDYAQLAGLLQQQAGGGLHVEVADVSRLDWGRNAAGLRYGDYWRGTLKPRPTGGFRAWVAAQGAGPSCCSCPAPRVPPLMAAHDRRPGALLRCVLRGPSSWSARPLAC